MIKKYAFLIGNIAMFLGTIYVVTLIYNAIFFDIEPIYEFLKRNIPIYHASTFIIAAIIYALIFKVKQWIHKDKALTLLKTIKIRKISGSNVLLMFVAGMAGWLSSIGFLEIELTANQFPQLQELIDYFMTAELFLTVLICGGIILPVFEELLFRGILFNLMRKHMPIIIALLIQAVFYAYFQPFFIISIISLFTGIVYCVFYYRLNSIVAPVIVQITAMSLIYITEVSGLRSVFQAMGQPALYVMTILSLVVLFGLTYYVWKKDLPTDSSKSESARNEDAVLTDS